MGVHSATFGPIKYAILPQALQREELIGGNALIETGTQLAMLLGLIVGSALIEIGSTGTLWAGTLTLTLAVVGYLASRQIPPAPATAPMLQFNWNPFTETARVLAITRSDHAVFHAVLGISWYWFYATVLIAQLPNYTRLNLGGDGSVAILVLTLFSIGTGVGALLCERLSARRVEIGLVPLGALGLAVFGIDLYFARPGLALQQNMDWLAFVHGAGSVRIALDLALIGMFAGIYVVPLFAFIQQRTPSDRLSRVIAGNNIINALLICTGAGFGLGMDALGLGVPQTFLLAAVFGVLFVGFIFVRVPEFVARFAGWARLDRRRS
jgi:Major Facilitator Superfamily.